MAASDGRSASHEGRLSAGGTLSGNVTVEMSSGLMERFDKLYHAVQSSQEFDSGLQQTLKDISRVRETDLKRLIVLLPEIARETQATGDAKAREALDALIWGMAENNSFTLKLQPPARLR